LPWQHFPCSLPVLVRWIRFGPRLMLTCPLPPPPAPPCLVQPLPAGAPCPAYPAAQRLRCLPRYSMQRLSLALQTPCSPCPTLTAWVGGTPACLAPCLPASSVRSLRAVTLDAPPLLCPCTPLIDGPVGPITRLPRPAAPCLARLTLPYLASDNVCGWTGYAFGAVDYAAALPPPPLRPAPLPAALRVTASPRCLGQRLAPTPCPSSWIRPFALPGRWFSGWTVLIVAIHTLPFLAPTPLVPLRLTLYLTQRLAPLLAAACLARLATPRFARCFHSLACIAPLMPLFVPGRVNARLAALYLTRVLVLVTFLAFALFLPRLQRLPL